MFELEERGVERGVELELDELLGVDREVELGEEDDDPPPGL